MPRSAMTVWEVNISGRVTIVRRAPDESGRGCSGVARDYDTRQHRHERAYFGGFMIWV